MEKSHALGDAAKSGNVAPLAVFSICEADLATLHCTIKPLGLFILCYREECYIFFL